MITPQQAEKARHDLAVAKYAVDIEMHEKAIDAHLVETTGCVAADGSTEWIYGVRGVVPMVTETLVARYAPYWDVSFEQSSDRLVFRIAVSKPKRKRVRKPARAVDAQGASTVEDAEQDELSEPRTEIDSDGEYTTDGKRW